MVLNIDIFQGIVSKLEIPVSWQHYAGARSKLPQLSQEEEALMCGPGEIQLHRDLFSPRVCSFATSVAGTMVLNAEL